MLVRISKLVVCVCILLFSEQVFAHANHFYTNELVISEPMPTYQIQANSGELNPHFISSVQKAQLITFKLAINEKITKFFQQLNASKKPLQVTKELEQECNCLNNCSCLDCQCANCPMSVSCSAISIMLSSHNKLVNKLPIHEKILAVVTQHFISQPHTLLFKPPIQA